MIKQDYLLAMIEHFFKMIARMLRLKETDPEAVEPELEKIYSQFLNNNRAYFLTTGLSNLYQAFGESEKGISQAEMLAELFYRELQLFDRPEINPLIARKLIGLYDYIDAQTREFSIERMNRRKEIEQFLQ